MNRFAVAAGSQRGPHTSADRPWAEWIAWELEAAGYTTLIQAWDFRPGMNFVTEMQKGAAQSSRTLVVLSHQFLESGFAQAEWTSAFAKDPTGENGLLIPVRVAECEPPGLLRARIYVDFVGLSDEAVQTIAVLDWLSNHQRWLLIADNADTDGAKTAVLERLSPSLTGHVLITSRISDWPVNIREIRLDPLSPDEATRYLLDRVARRDHNAGTQAAAGLLAQELGNLPIALEQAASFIVEVRWSFDKYRQQLSESRPELLSVAKTWSITLNQLTPLARALLRIAAWWFAIDAIPRGVFAADREVLSEANSK